MNQTPRGAHGPHQDLAGFEVEAPRVLRALKDSVSEVLRSAGVDPAQPTRVHRALGINVNLAWQLCHVVRAVDLPPAQRVPGRVGFERFLEAARSAGASAGSVSVGREAFERFRMLMDEHAGDRATLDNLLSQNSSDGVLEIPKSAARAASRLASLVLGVECRARYHGIVQFYGAKHGLTELAQLNVYRDLQVSRSAKRVVLSHQATYSLGGASDPIHVSPIFDSFDASSTGVVQALSDVPLSAVRVCHEGTHHSVELDTADMPVGSRGRRTVVLATHRRWSDDWPADPDPDETYFRVHIPTRSFTCDLFLHDDIGGEGAPSVEAFADTERVQSWKFHSDRDQIPLGLRAMAVGRGDSFTPCADVPSHQKLVSDALERLGVDASSVRVFRVVLEYPFVPMSVQMTPSPCEG